MLGHRELSIDDYLVILRRRWRVILIPAVLGPVIAFGVALKLPSRYTSRTLILVEQQKVPDSYVKSVLMADLSVRLSTMQEQILSRTRLQPIIERFGLYKEDIGRKPTELLVEQMRKAISVIPVQSVVPVREGEVSLPGFYITFTANEPHLAQQVCQEITSMFIEEDLRVREQTAQGTTSFLETQLADAKHQMDEQDARLAEFKRRYMGELPEEAGANLSLIASLNTQLQAGTQALNGARRDKAYTESLLAQQVAAARAVKPGDSPRPESIDEQLAKAENQLLQLQARYTKDHPDVIKTKVLIEELRKKQHDAELARKIKPAENVEKAAGNEPIQIQELRSQLRAYEMTIEEDTREQARLQQQIKLYQSRMQLSPVIEQEYKKISRDYQTALELYNDLLKKKNQSAMTTNLERRQQGEQFRVMDPANLPQVRSFPNIPMFLAGGFGGGLALGLIIALWLELRDKSLRTETDVEFYLGLPTLVTVPTIGAENTRRRNSHAAGKKEKAREGQLLGV